MKFGNFKVPPFNSHFEGSYSEKQLSWLRTCATEKANNLQVLLDGTQVESVLEVGCGSAVVLAEVARRRIGQTHVGIDLVDPNVHLDTTAKGMQVRAYDGVTIPFSAASFDLVYASHVIEHVPDPRGLLAELHRVARRLIYVEVPCELHVRTTHRALQTTLDIGHINSYTPESFLLLLQTSGLHVKDARLFDHIFEVHRFHSSYIAGTAKGLVRQALLAISPVLASRTFTYHFGVICGKE